MEHAKSLSKAPAWLSLCRLSINADAPLLGYVVFCWIVAWLAIVFVDGFRTGPALIFLVGTLSLIVPLMLVSFVVLRFYSFVVSERPESPMRQLLSDMKLAFLESAISARWAVTFIGMVAFAICFTLGKGNITVFMPFVWDQTFDNWDVAVHFGHRPYVLLQPILGYWPVTQILNIHYNFWFLAVVMGWTHFIIIEKPGFDRTRYLLSFVMTWSIGGVLLASLLSSAGPVYFEQVTGSNLYSPLVTYLNEANKQGTIWAVETQALLWDAHGKGSVFAGVSAMPSMHSAIALLHALVLWPKGWFLRTVGILHVVLILLGSIHLGWHYATDGYVGWAVALSLWVISGKIAKWWSKHPAMIEATDIARSFDFGQNKSA
jgi:hypothetical protein